MTLGEQIRMAREAKRITLRQLARTVGVSAPFVSDVEHDRRSLTPERRVQFADALGIDPALLDAASGYTRDLAEWIASNPGLVRMLRESRSSGRPLVIGGEHCWCCPLGRHKP